MKRLKGGVSLFLTPACWSAPVTSERGIFQEPQRHQVPVPRPVRLQLRPCRLRGVGLRPTPSRPPRVFLCCCPCAISSTCHLQRYLIPGMPGSKKKAFLEQRVSPRSLPSPPARASRTSGTFHLKGEPGTGEVQYRREGGLGDVGGRSAEPLTPPASSSATSYRPAQGLFATYALTPKCQHGRIWL